MRQSNKPFRNNALWISSAGANAFKEPNLRLHKGLSFSPQEDYGSLTTMVACGGLSVNRMH